MNKHRKAELRKWHRKDADGMCTQCGTRSFDGDFYVAEWPCHTIQVLDAWEAETQTRTEGEGR